MNLKKKLLASTATIAVGAMATIGGTFAYFGDTTVSANQFTNGTLKLAPSTQYVETFTIADWKPGDVLDAGEANVEPAITLNSQGTLPMNVFLKVDLDNAATNLSKDHIVVNKLAFGGVDLLSKFTDTNGDTRISLAELDAQSEGDTTLNDNLHSGVGKYIGFLNASGEAGAIKTLTYELEFFDNNTNQFALEGEVTGIDFKFTGLQYEGITLDKTNLTNNSNGGGGNYERTDDVGTDADTVNRTN